MYVIQQYRNLCVVSKQIYTLGPNPVWISTLTFVTHVSQNINCILISLWTLYCVSDFICITLESNFMELVTQDGDKEIKETDTQYSGSNKVRTK